MFNSPWGTFTVLATIPIAMIMGVYMYKIRPGDIKGGSIIGVALLALSIYVGPMVAADPLLAKMFTFTKKELSLIIPIYGFAASVLPVWFLLVPRDYLSTYLKIGTIAALAIGIVFVNPQMHMPAVTDYFFGGGPVIPGAAFPFLFITIACGALSGFHAIIGSGTTPKMIANEKDVLFVGYGAMLTEGCVAIMALIAACVLVPADYFAINAAPAAFAKLGLATVNLPELAQQVGEQVQGRPGGAVSLAVGMAYIFSAVPFMKGMMAYWYHFAIMFEAVFILTAIDAGTRVGRYLLQEMLGRVYKPFSDNSWTPGIIITSALFTGAWGYLLYTGDIATIWPLFGMANQLLASCALIVGTTMLIRIGKAKYAWVTAGPGLCVFPIVMWAGYLNVTTNFLPKQLYLLATMSIILMVLISIVFIAAFYRWNTLLKVEKPVKDEHGDDVLALVNEN
jgi:carbon starvation protein